LPALQIAVLESAENKEGMIMDSLKGIAFKAYKAEHWPADVNESTCANYTEENPCCEGRGPKVCVPCETYNRLVEEFQALPIG
jgi:hypothetical protein